MRKVTIYLTILLFSGNTLYASFWKPEDVQFDSLVFVLENAFKDYDQPLIEKTIPLLYKLAGEKNNKVLLSRAKYWDARNNINININLTDKLVDEAILLIDTTKYDYDYARWMFLRARIIKDKGYIIDSYRIYDELISYFSKIGDTLYIANTYVDKAILLNMIGEISEALSLFQTANEYFEKAGEKIFAIKNRLNIYNIRLGMGESDMVYDELEQLLKEPFIQQDTSFLINIMMSLYHYGTESSKRSKYAIEAYNIASKLKSPILLSHTLINMGSMYRQVNQLDSAIYYYRQSYNHYRKLGYIKDLSISSYGLYICFEADAKLDSALFYLKEYTAYSDSLFSTEKVSEINKMQAQTAINTYKAQLQLAKERADFEKRRSSMIFIVVISIGALVCYILWTRWRKTKTEKKIKELENKELNTHLENEKLRSENFQMEIDFKNRELTTNALMLGEKNHILRDIKTEIETLNLNGLIPYKEKNILDKKIDEHLSADDEWNYIKERFESVHPDFFTKLKEKAPKLSENELRLCVYVHIGMPTKQIARILSILPETVNTNRYRIRKKMGLEEDVVLEDFLRGM